MDQSRRTRDAEAPRNRMMDTGRRRQAAAETDRRGRGGEPSVRVNAEEQVKPKDT